MERSWQGRTLLLLIPPPGRCLLAPHWPASLRCPSRAGEAGLQSRPWGRPQHQEASERRTAPAPLSEIRRAS